LATKKIYLIRHGQTDYNLKGIVQGSKVNTSLNDLGRAQANAFFEHYKEIAFDKIYTSILNRSKESVAQFVNLGIPHEAYEGLNEISWGFRDGTEITKQEDDYYFQVLKQWSAGNLDLKIEGGESPLDVIERQKPVIEIINSRTEEENILVCMHGRAIRIILCLLLNKPLVEMDSFSHENLCLYLLESDENGGYKVLKYNDVTHLIEQNLRSAK